MASSRVVTQAIPQRQPALPYMVGLAALFLLLTAFIASARGGNLFSEDSMLYVALVLFGAATVLYDAFAITGAERNGNFAILATGLGFLATTAAAGHRWYLTGHPPFASIYEMLLAFVWMLAAVTVVADRRYRLRLVGTITMPLAVVGIVLMQLLPSDVHPLVPALQSTWLHIHVTLAMLSYAALAVSAALAIMFLVQDNVQTESFLVASSLLLTGIYGGVLSRFRLDGSLQVMAWDPEAGRQIFLAERVPVILAIPNLGWIFLLVAAVVAAPAATYFFFLLRGKRQPELLEWMRRLFFVGLPLQALALAAFILRTRNQSYYSLNDEALYPTALAASPFIISGIVAGILVAAGSLLLMWRREDVERMLPAPATLDRLTYKSISVAFPLLTLMIASGAYWANRTWGSYWSWDPKETWALITWLTYAAFLHMRVTRGWRGRRAAYFAIIGFVVVLFTFLGVTYLLPGLHAYV